MENDRLVLIDGNSIMNRAFYGIMANKMLTANGVPTNAIYGFLTIMFKIIENLNPKYMVVTFDLKAPTQRHIKYEAYKANRHGMPDELAVQMPIIKDILHKMNITIIEKEGYEADDVLGTLSKRAEKEGLNVTILSGDRDTFQLASDKITIRIPRTKMGKTEEEDFDRNKVFEVYGLEPIQMIELKGLMGDSSDNIPGVPGVGEKTALTLIKEYGTIAKLYKCLENGKSNVTGKLKEKLIENKELAELSRFLGTINLKVPIKETIDSFILEDWKSPEVFEKFKELRFNRFIDRFNLVGEEKEEKMESFFEIKDLTGPEIEILKEKIKEEREFTYNFICEKDENNNKIINKKIMGITIYNKTENIVYYKKFEQESEIQDFKEIFEDNKIEKNGYNLDLDIVLLKQLNIIMKNIKFDAEIASYVLNPGESNYSLERLSSLYLNIDLEKHNDCNNEEVPINLFDIMDKNNEKEKYKIAIQSYIIGNLKKVLIEKLKDLR